ncbi:RTA1 like protein [Coniochaeta ligniaria NRRL 30616]|uniref:RTA1 like protein n=1 Tax=Coniochaeta ligniaria NRRL 30616 TaxID=1408157 RepID=A0A1J7JVB6_9PEZI|nr:RTA1 like protein [Coniochaeta ligniaria NRRL 30616]
MSHQGPHCVGFGPNSNCTLEVCSVEHSVYRYRPSLAANVVFIAIFALLMAIQIVLGMRWKTWWFMWCIVTGCVSEIIGYAGRVMMYYNPFKFAPFMIQIVCVTSAPVYFCAAIYVTLALTVTNLSPETARFPPKYFFWVFITSDLTSLVLQAVGGALSTQSSGASQTAVNLALGGLGLQVFTLVIFSGLMVDFLVRFARTARAVTVLDRRMKIFIGALSAAILLILARCAYRVDELSEGYSGPLVANEGLFIGLEGVLIAVTTFLLCVGHPGFAFKDYSAKGSMSERDNVEFQVIQEGKQSGTI